MRPVVFVVPGTMRTLTGGYLYNQHVIDTLRELGWTVDILSLDSSFPRPTRDALAQADALLSGVAADAMLVVDSLALGAMPDLIEREAARRPVVALMHLPLTAAIGLDPQTEREFEEGERRALQAAAQVIVTGRAAIPLLARYELPEERVTVVPPGVTPAPVARGTAGLDGESNTPVQLLSVGTVNREKGHDVLVRALGALPVLRWRLMCVGSLTRDRAAVAKVRAVVRELGLDHRITFTGELEGAALQEAYDRADIFVLPSLRETYGMAMTEALARGIPVVGSATGALPELVGTEAGVVVPPGNEWALSDALEHVIGDVDLRTQLADGALAVRDRLPSWVDAATQFALALKVAAIA